MSEFKVQQLETQLRALRQHSPAVIGSIILSNDGFPIAADLPPSGLGEDRSAARSAAMVALGERIAQELRRGELEQIYMGGNTGGIVIALINPDVALTVLCEDDVRIAMTLLDVSHSVEELKRLL